MKLKGLGDIRTSGRVPDRRKIGSPHGAYLELSAIALQRRRLTQEIKAAGARGKLMKRQLEALERRAAVLRRFVDTRDESVLEPLLRSPRRASRRTQAVREAELRY